MSCCFGFIQVGMEVLDICMVSFDGKEYVLSDLCGKVVLFDFWVSWCGFCCCENFNVVVVYNCYKDQGFMVYSVFFDGLDSRGKVCYCIQEDIDCVMEGQKQCWVNVIQQDGLLWEYYVSDF